MSRIVVVGAGIAGLTTAYLLRKRGADVTVLEAGARAGGVIRSTWEDGMLCEWGPQAILDNAPETQSLIESLGLTGQVLRSNDDARRRFILRHGRFHDVPMAPQKFMFSPLLSVRGRLRALREPGVPKAPHGMVETLYDFGVRRVGKEAAEVLMDAMAAGVFAGDPKRMELDACFPKVREMEQKHGGLIQGMMAQARSSGGKRAVLQSFTDGMQTLVDALANSLGNAVRLHAPVARVERDGAAWRVVTTSGEPLPADRVVVATPAFHAADLLSSVLGAAATDALRGIPYAPVGVVCHAFSEADAPAHVRELSHSFGFLIPSAEAEVHGTEILGALFTRGAFPIHGAHGTICVRSLVGGMRSPQSAAFSDEEFRSRVTRQLTHLLGMEVEPQIRKVIRWQRGIAQYTPGHLNRLKRIDAALTALKGLYVVGSAYRGPGVNDCIREATRLAAGITTRVAVP